MRRKGLPTFVSLATVALCAVLKRTCYDLTAAKWEEYWANLFMLCNVHKKNKAQQKHDTSGKTLHGWNDLSVVKSHPSISVDQCAARHTSQMFCKLVLNSVVLEGEAMTLVELRLLIILFYKIVSVSQTAEIYLYKVDMFFFHIFKTITTEYRWTLYVGLCQWMLVPCLLIYLTQ